MRRYNECVFDDMIYGSDTVYTGAQYAELLGSTDQRTIQVITSELGAFATHLTVQIEQSPDGIRWKPKKATPEIDHALVSHDVISSSVGFDDGGTPGDGLARLAISLFDATGIPSAAVRVYVTGRDRVKQPLGHCGCAPKEHDEEPDEDAAALELVRRAIDDAMTSRGELLGVETMMRLEWARALLAQLPPEERAAAIFEELGEDGRIEVLDAMHRIAGEMEAQRLTLVRNGPTQTSEPPHVHPMAVRLVLHEYLQLEPPVVSLTPEGMERLRALASAAPGGSPAERAAELLDAIGPGGARDLMSLLQRTLESLDEVGE